MPPWKVGDWPGAGKSDKGLKTLSGLLRELCSDDVTPEGAVEAVNGYYDPILKENFDNFPKRQKDLEHMVPMAGRYNKLRAFLDDLVLEPPSSRADISSDTAGNHLTLSTVHSAKGLEWSVVFIIWVMEGYFPSARAYSSMESIEEERRLMYVAATRAKDHLIMCYPGQEELPVWQLAETGYNSGLSSFIRALPEDVVEHVSTGPSRRRPVFSWPRDRGPVRKRGNFMPSSANDLETGEEGPQKLRPGDRVKHPAFGRGVISKFMDSTKVEVLFRDVGRKLLHLEHTTLEKI